MTALGVKFATPPLDSGLPTGRCLILVTPDAQRTMNTCPGASHELTERALDEALIRSAAVTFLEGYLWGPERPRRAMLAAAQIAHDAGRVVAFTLSESLCIPGRREGVWGMIEARTVDILFGNEDEVRHLTGCGALGDCIAALSGLVETLVITRGAEGAIAVSGESTATIEAAPVDSIVDTTGAGDLFAAGFISAHCRRRGLGACLRAGSLAAAEVISHFGARPEKDLREIVRL
jgi:sugar/nucleoside kinase (ribokinase family)